ncbi:hypothetical protein MW887_009943 [Aspergillus wentii]|nr:hypothetical protein MW887_009943 [Aspergillus wentii]
MVQLQDLPTEILSVCLSFVEESDDLDEEQGRKIKLENSDVRNLFNVCLVSRRFRELAQPLLFRSFEMDDIDTKSTIRFIRAITTRPQLGEHVQIVNIMDIDQDDLPPGHILSAEDKEFLTCAIQDLKLDSKKKEKTWLAALDQMDQGVFLALILSKTPNLRYISIPGVMQSMKQVNQLFARDPSFLSKLEQVHIEGDGECSGFNIATFREFCTRPRVDFMTIDSGNLTSANYPASWSQGTITPQTIQFRFCHVDQSSVIKLLHACKNIKTFIFSNWDNGLTGELVDSSLPTFNAEHLHEALQPHRERLEHLHIEYHLSQDHASIQGLIAQQALQPKMPSLLDFPVLHTLHIQHCLLPELPDFPSSLRELWIRDCTSSIRNMTHHIAKDVRSGKYPELVKIMVLAMDITHPIRWPGQRIPDGKTSANCFFSLRDLFKDTKVDYQIVPYKNSDLDENDYTDEGDYADDYADDYGDYEDYTPEALRGAGMRGIMEEVARVMEERVQK